MSAHAAQAKSPNRLRSPLLALLAAGSLGACVKGPGFQTPPPPSAEAGYASDGAGRAALGQEVDLAWWTAFKSAELDGLVNRALERNHSLAASMATLERAREHINAAAGRRLPQVDARARAEYQQVNLSAFGLGDRLDGTGVGNPDFDLYTLGAGVSYDLDLFGGKRRALEQATAEAEAQRHETEAAHLLVAGRVTLQVLAIAALNDRLATERALIAEDERNLELTDRRRRAGVGTMVEVLSAEGQLASDKASLPLIEQQLAEARTMLAILIGVSPAELGPTGWSLDAFALPEQVPVALPSALVHKRPDILEAEARLHAATAAIGVAEARLYPEVTIGASLTQSTSQPEKLFSTNSTAFDLFAGLTAPIFHGGTLKAEKRGAEAAARASLESYKQVVLESFGQVSDLLTAMGTDRDALAAQQRSVDVAARSLHLSRRSFEVGYSGILQVLDASRAHQRARIALVEARSRQYFNVARLYAATAGGWTGVPGTQVAEVK